MPTASLAWCLDSRNSQSIVGGDHLVDRCLGDATMPGNVLGFARFCQGIINDKPALTTPRPSVRFEPLFHFFN
jgi:hypothetical protein